MATIKEYNGERGISYQVRYRIEGKQKTKSFASKREAGKFKKQIEAEKVLGIAKEETQIKFETYASQFLEIHKENIKNNTYLSYIDTLRVVNRKIGSIKLKDLTPKKLDDFFKELRKINSENTIKQKLKVVDMILKSAYKQGIIEYNPIERMIFKVKSNEEEKTKVISLDDFKAFMNQLNYDYMKHFALIAIHTGMRRGEVLSLRWENVDLENNYIYVVENLNKHMEITTPKSKKSKRPIIINDTLKNIFIQIKENQNEWKEKFLESYIDNDLVVSLEDGEYIPPEKITKRFNYVSDKIKIKCYPHMLRHTFATLLEEMSIKQVQTLMGHNDIKITANTYQHFTEYNKDTVDILNSKLKNIN